MGPIAEMIEEQVVLDVLQEAFDELAGRSNKKWAVVVVAAIVGGAIGLFIVRRRRGGDVIDELPDQLRV